MDNKKEQSKTIKIKLDENDHLKEYAKELRRWEGEGGDTTELNDIFDEIKLPVKPGDAFKVTDGSIIFEDNEYYYMINIDRQSQ